MVRENGKHYLPATRILEAKRLGSIFTKETSSQEALLYMGNKALSHVAKDIFDPRLGYLYASVMGTFDWPFTRDALISGHFLRKAVEDAHVVNINQQIVLNDMQERVKKSFNFLWKNQKPDGFLTHEMKPFNPQDGLYKKGFYTYKEGDPFMINGDSVDATPRGLMEAVRLLSPKEAVDFAPQAVKAFDAMQEHMNMHDGFLTFDGAQDRLMSWGWMDSVQGRPLDNNGNIIPGSVAPIEVQAYAWSAQVRWANLLKRLFPMDHPYYQKAHELEENARLLKEKFNKAFRTDDGYFAHALVMQKNGDNTWQQKQDQRVSINAALAVEADVRGETIFATHEDIKNVVSHLLQPTMFHPETGVFTFDAGSVDEKHSPDGYHYGKYVCWPFASLLAGEGIAKVAQEIGWEEGVAYGNKIMQASLMPIINTESFLEQFTYNDSEENTKEKYVRFRHKGIDVPSNATQTWTIAAYLRGLSYFGLLSQLDFSTYWNERALAVNGPSRRRISEQPVAAH